MLVPEAVQEHKRPNSWLGMLKNAKYTKGKELFTKQIRKVRIRKLEHEC